MRQFRLIVEPRGGLLTGGHEARALFADDATSRDAEGVAYIAASALKGAIREQVQRIAGGIAAAADDADAIDARDIVQRLFGREGSTDTPGERGHVRVSDGIVHESTVRELFQTRSGYALRHGVSIDRRSRRSAEERLFLREIVAPFVPGLRFQADLVLASASSAEEDAVLLRWLQAGVRGVYAIGAGRTGGLGAVTFRLEPAAAAVTRAQVTESLPGGPWFRLTLTARDPLCLGLDHNSGIHHATSTRIPASTLRGALVTAAMRHRRETNDLRATGDPEFRTAVLDPETCLRVTDALATRDAQAVAPRIAPQTLRACKLHPTPACRDYLYDSLIDEWLDAEPSSALQRPAGCPHCDGRQGRLDATARELGARADRVVLTRTAIDPRLGGAEHEKLFSIEAIAGGTRFEAWVHAPSAEARRVLAQALAEDVEVGHGRRKGFGRCAVSIAPGAPESLRERVKRFDDELRRRAAKRKVDVSTHPLVVAALALTDIALPASDGVRRVNETFCKLLGFEDAVLLDGRGRAGRSGGWDTSPAGGHRKLLSPTIRCGSVVLVALGRRIDEALGDLARIEERGVGERRDEGFGWVRFCDPLHREGSQQ